MSNAVIFLFPFLIDIVVSLVLFVSRHSLAGLGHPQSVIIIPQMLFGIGYIVACFAMKYIVSLRHSRAQMIGAVLALMLICIVLANISILAAIYAMFLLLPLTTSLFFNAFQAYMLGVSQSTGKTLAATVGHYTFAWSLGYAVGPFVPGLLKNSLTWNQTYYCAAASALIVAILAICIRPSKNKTAEPKAAPVLQPIPLSNLPWRIIAGRIGIILGWTGWNMICVYWPMQANALHLSSTVKGVMECSFALFQACTALALIRYASWVRSPVFTIGFGVIGIAALILFSHASGSVHFVVAAMLFGVFTGSVFYYALFMAMSDTTVVVKQIALNEALVGIAFMISSGLAMLIHKTGTPFVVPYYIMAIALGAGVVLQIALIRHKKS